MSTKRSLAFGAAVAVVYVSVAVMTAHLSGHSVLPLYEGVGPPVQYQWVNPPKAFATGNVVPGPNTTTIAVGATGSNQGGIASTDTQFIVTLSDGAIPAKAGSTQASVLMEPLDPATLDPLPAGTSPDGNAYRLSVRYDPNLGTLARVAVRASAVLSVPLPANRGIYFSPTGRGWKQLAVPAATQTSTVGASFFDMGVFLAGTTHSANAGGGTSGTSVVTVIIGVLVGLLLVGGGAWFLLRLRHTPRGRR